MRSRMIRDTAVLTVMQLFLDTAALVLNAFITRRLGASGMGILTLTGSFLGLASVISNGNAFLCTSRLISEELGKPDSNPNGVLLHGVKLCLMLSVSVSAFIFIFAGRLSGRFFGGTDMTAAVRIMPAALICGAVGGCLKGYFNASRRSSVAAVGDVIEFIVKSAVIIVMSIAEGSHDESGICVIMISAIAAGNAVSLTFLAAAYKRQYTRCGGKSSLSFGKYVSLALPIMGGSVLTAVLSSTNDALIPVCLRQYGDSAGEALSLFGIFEAIVIPTLFFPSVVLCSMSGLIVSEAARAAAAGNSGRIRSLGSRLTEWTLMYAIFASAVLIRFGGAIGELLGGGALAGHMISLIAPVVPFIYMEIILEAMIKGMGLQGFSSLNYLAEYAVRIALVLIFVPFTGFYGIAASYYASNIIGNCSRFIFLWRRGGTDFRPLGMIAMPIMYAFLTMGGAELISGLFGIDSSNAAGMAVFALLWGIGYFAVFVGLGKVRLIDRKRSFVFVHNSQ